MGRRLLVSRNVKPLHFTEESVIALREYHSLGELTGYHFLAAVAPAIPADKLPEIMPGFSTNHPVTFFSYSQIVDSTGISEMLRMYGSEEQQNRKMNEQLLEINSAFRHENWMIDLNQRGVGENNEVLAKMQKTTWNRRMHEISYLVGGEYQAPVATALGRVLGTQTHISQIRQLIHDLTERGKD